MSFNTPNTSSSDKATTGHVGSIADYPEAYRRGFIEFMGRRFTVDERVYVPTQETSRLVSMAQRVLASGRREGPIVDVGTG